MCRPPRARRSVFAIVATVVGNTLANCHRREANLTSRRGHVAAMYFMSGTSLILSVAARDHFWVSYAFMCLAIPGPFAAMAPFWAIPSETLPRSVMGVVMGLVNAFGNLGGFVGPYIVGWLVKEYHTTTIAFNALGAGMLACVALAFLLPKSKLQAASATPA